GDRSELALPKQVQRDPIKGFLEHVDLLIVARGEKVVVDVPIEIEGSAAPGSMVSLDQTTLTVEAEATHIPEQIAVSVEGAEIGTQIHAGEIPLPEGLPLHEPADTLIVHVTAAQSAEAAPEEAEGEAEADEQE